MSLSSMISEQHRWPQFMPILLSSMLLNTWACSREEQSPSTPPSKNDVVKWEKADGLDALCYKYQLPPGCDLCDHFGWYTDGACDQWLVSEKICKQPDPDCSYINKPDAGVYQDSKPGDKGVPIVDVTPPPITWTACDTSTWYQGKPYPVAGVECTTFQVPLDHSKPTGKTIPLYVARHKSKIFPTSKAVFQLAGGPGGSSVGQSGLIPMIMPKLLDNFDLIYVDQRGTGGSGYLGCSSNNFASCASEHADKDLNHYLSVDAAHDLEWVRIKLGYDKIYLRGGSYGTRLGLEFIRQHESSVAAAVLDGLDTPDWDAFADAIKKADREVNRLIADCNKDTACKTLVPDLAGDLEKRRQALREHPRKIDVNGTPDVEDEYLYILSLASFVEDAYWRFSIPKAIHQSLEGNNKTWNSMLTELFGVTITDGKTNGSPPSPSSAEPLLRKKTARPWRLPFPSVRGLVSYVADGLNITVNCAESFPNSEGVPTLQKLLESQVWGTLSSMVEMANACASWKVNPLDAALRQPVRSNVKVLLLSGDIDFVTPPEIGEHAGKTLPNSTHLVIPYASHSTMLVPCAGEIITNFLKADGDIAKVDVSCVKKIPAPNW